MMVPELAKNPYYTRALEFIRDNDLASMENGRHEIDGDNLYVNIVDCDLRSADKARLEVHDRYIDVQMPLSGCETFGVKPRCECISPDGSMDSEKDIMFFNDPVEDTVAVRQGEIIVFAPETAHAPLIGSGKIRKAIFKVRVC